MYSPPQTQPQQEKQQQQQPSTKSLIYGIPIPLNNIRAHVHIYSGDYDRGMSGLCTVSDSPMAIHSPSLLSVYFVLLPLAPRLRIFVYADSSRIPRRGEIDRAPKMCKQCFEDRSIVHSRSFARSSEKSFNIRRRSMKR